MKKVKIMLLSLSLFAVVGGALAFKARFQQDYCTGVAVGAINTGVACVNHAISTTTDDIQAKFVATTTYNGGCPSNLKCTTTSIRLTPDLP